METQLNPDAESHQSVAILGGSGFIGSRLVGRLIELERSPRIGDLLPSDAFPHLWMHCDVRDAASMLPFLTGSASIVNLAAEHRDDVIPISRYHQTNVEGAQQVCIAAEDVGISKIIFASSVAVYGFHPETVDEDGPLTPFNPYGESKLQAEAIYIAWASKDPTRTLVIVRPTVVFGEGNRGNVYNLLRQIASGRFMMIGPGTNRKSLAYVGNVADFFAYTLTLGPGIHIFNYADGPDMDMNTLVDHVHRCLNQKIRINIRIPMVLGLAGGYLLDRMAQLTGRSFSISAIRVRKFCGNTQFTTSRISSSEFTSRFTLEEGLTNTIKSEFGPLSQT